MPVSDNLNIKANIDTSQAEQGVKRLRATTEQLDKITNNVGKNFEFLQSLKLNEVQGAVGRVEKSFSNARNSIRDATGATDKFTGSFKTLDNAAGLAEQQLTAIGAVNVINVGQDIANVSKQSETLGEEAEQAKSSLEEINSVKLDNIQKQLEAVEDSNKAVELAAMDSVQQLESYDDVPLDSVNKELEDVTDSTEELEEGTRKAKEQLEETNEVKLTAINHAMRELRDLIIVAGAAFVTAKLIPNLIQTRKEGIQLRESFEALGLSTEQVRGELEKLSRISIILRTSMTNVHDGLTALQRVLAGTTDEAVEYQKILLSLTQAFRNAGVESDNINTSIERIAGVFRDTEKPVLQLANLFREFPTLGKEYVQTASEIGITGDATFQALTQSIIAGNFAVEEHIEVLSNLDRSYTSLAKESNTLIGRISSAYQALQNATVVSLKNIAASKRLGDEFVRVRNGLRGMSRDANQLNQQTTGLIDRFVALIKSLGPLRVTLIAIATASLVAGRGLTGLVTSFGFSVAKITGLTLALTVYREEVGNFAKATIKAFAAVYQNINIYVTRISKILIGLFDLFVIGTGAIGQLVRVVKNLGTEGTVIERLGEGIANTIENFARAPAKIYEGLFPPEQNLEDFGKDIDNVIDKLVNAGYEFETTGAITRDTLKGFGIPDAVIDSIIQYSQTSKEGFGEVLKIIRLLRSESKNGPIDLDALKETNSELQDFFEQLNKSQGAFERLGGTEGFEGLAGGRGGGFRSGRSAIGGAAGLGEEPGFDPLAFATQVGGQLLQTVERSIDRGYELATTPFVDTLGELRQQQAETSAEAQRALAGLTAQVQQERRSIDQLNRSNDTLQSLHDDLVSSGFVDEAEELRGRINKNLVEIRDREKKIQEIDEDILDENDKQNENLGKIDKSINDIEKERQRREEKQRQDAEQARRQAQQRQKTGGFFRGLLGVASTALSFVPGAGAFAPLVNQAGNAALSAGGYQQGGYTGRGAPGAIAGYVHRNEYVLNPRQTSNLLAGDTLSLSNSNNSRPITIEINLDGERIASRIVSSDAGERAVLDVLSRNSIEATA